jgi:hypothetical protein
MQQNQLLQNQIQQLLQQQQPSRSEIAPRPIEEDQQFTKPLAPIAHAIEKSLERIAKKPNTQNSATKQDRNQQKQRETKGAVKIRSRSNSNQSKSSDTPPLKKQSTGKNQQSTYKDEDDDDDDDDDDEML